MFWIFEGGGSLAAFFTGFLGCCFAESCFESLDDFEDGSLEMEPDASAALMTNTCSRE